MALFCAAIKRDSVSLLGFPFTTHDQVFSCEMSLVIIILLILVFMLFLVALISLSLFFYTLSSRHHIEVSTLSSMLTSPFPSSFLATYIMFIISLAFKDSLVF